MYTSTTIIITVSSIVYLVYKRMTSCEKSMTAPYSNDLRWRAVWQIDGLGNSCQQTAEYLGVDVSTAHRILQQFHLTGEVSKKQYPADCAYKKLNNTAQLFILHLVLARPGIYLREIVSELQTSTGIEVTESAVCKFLKKAGFSRQKMHVFAIQQDSMLRTQFAADVSL